MSRQSVDWSAMYRALEAFRKENGHCRVQANCRKNPQLGRWVAMQRYRRRIGELASEYVTQLDKLGFVWSPTDIVWNEMFEKLRRFKKRKAHCDVPSVWPEDPHLASWVANQRHRKKAGSLLPERVKRLEHIGFAWAVYGKDAPARNRDEKKVEAVVAEPETEERLYLAYGEYVQYGGVGDLPPKLVKYLQQHRGEFPPYIPLPRGPLTFLVGDPSVKVRKLVWSGKGAIPEDVREYVNENGVLPQHGY